MVELDNRVSFADLNEGDFFEHNGRLFQKSNVAGSAQALDNGGVDSSFTAANMVAERPDAVVVAIPSSQFQT